MSQETVIVPRNFKLLDELEVAEKGSTTVTLDHNLSLGLASPTDTFLRNWNASILGPQGTTFDNRFYSLEFEVSDSYPTTLPSVKFVEQKINLPFVSSTGSCDLTKVAGLKSWGSNRSMGLYDVLKAIKAEMSSSGCRKLSQPREGECY